MQSDLRERIEKARTLSDIDKLALIDELMALLDRPDPAIDRIWADEAEKRLRMYRDGRMQPIPYEKVMRI